MMKKLFVSKWLLAVAITVVMAVQAPVAAEAKPQNQFILGAKDERLILRLNDPSRAALDRLVQRFGLTLIRALPQTPGAYIVQGRSGILPGATEMWLRADATVSLVEVDQPGALTGADPSHMGAWGAPSARYYAQEAIHDMVSLGKARKYGKGKGTIVAVIDTGVQLDHPELQDVLLQGYDFVDGDADASDVKNGLDDNGDGRVDEVFGHGTHVAGIVHLVAPEARILPLRALDADGRGSTIDLIEAISYAMHRGATVINVSMGSSVRSALLSSVLRDAAARGVAVVASAGNGATESEQFPAADACAIAVGSTGDGTTLSSFSNYGRWLDFVAPGEAIFSTFPDRGGYAHWSGTSMAAPFVAGQIALLKANLPFLTSRQIATLMSSSAQPLTIQQEFQLKYAGKMGKGRINIGKAVEDAELNRARLEKGDLVSSSTAGKLGFAFNSVTNRQTTRFAPLGNFESTASMLSRQSAFSTQFGMDGADYLPLAGTKVCN